MELIFYIIIYICCCCCCCMGLCGVYKCVKSKCIKRHNNSVDIEDKPNTEEQTGHCVNFEISDLSNVSGLSGLSRLSELSRISEPSMLSKENDCRHSELV